MMQDGGAFLSPFLVPTPSCFVALPEPYVRSCLPNTNPNAGATVLQLTWHNGVETELAFVGWVGELSQGDALEVPIEFGRCLGLADAMERMPGLRVGVSVATLTPTIPMVHMEPCTADDWEIIQLHAGLLENEILRQICVVQHGQQIPVRIQQHTVVHLVVALPPDVPCARLSSNCEIAIAPKARPADDDTTGSHYEASAPLMLQPLNTTAPDGTAVRLVLADDEILVHPVTYAQLDGPPTGLRCASIWEDTGSETTTVLVGRLRCSTAVVPQYVAIASSLLRVLTPAAVTRVRLRVLKTPPLTPLAVELAVPTPATDWADALREWWAAADGLVLAPHGAELRLRDTPVALTLRLRNDAPDTAALPVGAAMDYTLVSSANVPRLEDIRVELAAPRAAAPEAATPAPLVWPALQDVLGRVATFTNPVVSRPHAAARVVLGAATPPGSVLLWGPRGAGKSTLLKLIASHCATTTSILCPGIVVACRDLRGLKMDAVKAKLQEAFAQALQFAPCVLLLDDLDALAPPESDDGPSDQARRLAEHVAELLKHVRLAQATFAAQLRAAGASSAQLVRASTTKGVAVVATARDAHGVHPLLRTCGLFDRPVELALPDAGAREQILIALCRRKQPTDDPVDAPTAAHKTEGFSPRDLQHVVDRALHRHAIARRAQGAAPLELLAGLTDFTPAALRGVDLFKSVIHWADVGGLHDVRTMLKETLELPTKYMKLYRAAPLKLPSGVLLYGPPGCGKTMLAHAVASECGLNFISVKGPEVLNKYIGASEQAVRDLFARAAAAAPSVLFLDEFDAIAPRRGADNTGVTDRVVNQLLTFLDGVESRLGVYVLAATSRPDMIDPALLRPGRLDKSLYCGFPTMAERLDILHAVARKMELTAEATAFLAVVSQRAELYTGADLQAVLYAAQLAAVHETLPAADGRVDGRAADEAASCIQRRHVEQAFEASRPSVSADAKRRYDLMYGSFNNAKAPRVTDFATASSDVAFDAAPGAAQRSALY
ncbi:peroxisome biogenesis factor [Achlya hypogyna]|uniref:Peroxisomal ATPase PEX1 n=1 Tax=Achlya hypogyna TaxID=1202772 RepID=A0A1V9ZIS0_ACHHY|nr:peroxisome biogenesis factor [Achlya hypogyna]